jgi:hypothetical protein
LGTGKLRIHIRRQAVFVGKHLPHLIAIIRIGGIQLGEELFQLPKPQKRRKP